jgi:predicted RNase H-like HicB family nuclease
MIYPVYVHLGDAEHAHGVTIPDLPGCFSAADDWEDLPTQIQEAVELYFEGETIEIPTPTPLEQLAKDPRYQDGGIWMLVDIDFSRIRPKSVKVRVSLPASLVGRIDASAKKRRMSRSGFLEQAARHALEAEERNAT